MAHSHRGGEGGAVFHRSIRPQRWGLWCFEFSGAFRAPSPVLAVTRKMVTGLP